MHPFLFNHIPVMVGLIIFILSLIIAMTFFKTFKARILVWLGGIAASLVGGYLTILVLMQ